MCLDRTEERLGRPLRPDDLPNLPLISPGDDWWDIWFRAAGVDGGTRPRPPGLRLDSQADEGHAAMGGQGFVLLTPAFWRNDLRDGRLVRPFELTATAGYRYFLVVPPERRNIPKIKRFREWLLAAMADAACTVKAAQLEASADNVTPALSAARRDWARWVPRKS